MMLLGSTPTLNLWRSLFEVGFEHNLFVRCGKGAVFGRFCALLAITLIFTGCDVERRKSDAELGLTARQATGRRIYDQYCDRCHAPYSSKSRQGPSLKHIFQSPYLKDSGLPANDDRVTDIIRLGRDKMPGFAQVLSQQQVDDLLAYLHTL